MYKTVYDLTKEELSELKYSFFDDPDSLEILSPDMVYPEDIPDSLILQHYAGVSFTDDDFFCNIKED